MKTILIATDFSAASRNAAVYGLALARAFETKVILFSSYFELPVPVTDIPVVMTPKDMKKHVQELLVQEEMIINTGSRVTVETVCSEGPSADMILKVAKEKDAGLIILGMKEGGKAVRRVLGNTVTALASKTAVPLVIVPEGVQYSNITSIALANESDLEPDADEHLLDSLREIASRFHSKIYLVRVAGNRVKAAYESAHRPLTLIRMIESLDPSYGSIEGNSVPTALNHFIEGHQVKMLAMLPHMHSLFGKLFVRSTTRAMIFASNIPLLIVPGIQPKKGTAESLHHEANH
jgi:nucleotide-binding universal stress UspA family protein